MADNTEVPKIPEQPKKAPKKLTIFDANEQSEPAKAAPSKIHVKSDDNPSVPNVPDTKAGDTPAVLVDEEEMAAIAEAFANIPEVAQTPAATPIEMPVEPKKISVLHDDSQELPEPLQSASPAPEPEEAAETANEDSAEDVTADSSETETVPVPVEDTAEVTDEMPVTPPKKALDQLRNNVPSPPAPEPISEIAGETEKFADKETENVVDDIVATESDELLAREDAEAARAVKPPKKPNRLREILSNWWLNPATKWGAIVGLILLLGLIGLLPLSRYAILNAAGVRVQSSLNVISNESQQPLKNVQVNIGGQSAVTDDNGTVKFEKLKLGKTTLKIVKRGFSSVDQVRTLGWGSNPIGQVGLAATGTKFSFVAKDFLSGKAVLGAEATSGEYNAQADKDGKIALVIDKDNDKDLEVSIKATGYRDEKLTVKLTDLIEKTIKMAPAKKHVFVSKRSGKLDVFKIDADGKNEEKLLAATGTERDDLALLPHPTSDFVAMVSTREGKHNSAGYLLSSLFVINVKTGELTKIVQSERIQLIDWSADREIGRASCRERVLWYV